HEQRRQAVTSPSTTRFRSLVAERVEADLLRGAWSRRKLEQVPEDAVVLGLLLELRARVLLRADGEVRGKDARQRNEREERVDPRDRQSTRLNYSHVASSYA